MSQVLSGVVGALRCPHASVTVIGNVNVAVSPSASVAVSVYVVTTWTAVGVPVNIPPVGPVAAGGVYVSPSGKSRGVSVYGYCGVGVPTIRPPSGYLPITSATDGSYRSPVGNAGVTTNVNTGVPVTVGSGNGAGG